MKDESLPAGALTTVKTPRRVSERKLKANRENSKKSTGPRTVRGKAYSRSHAVKHGFFARDLFPLMKLKLKAERSFERTASGSAKNTSRWKMVKSGRSSASPFASGSWGESGAMKTRKSITR